MLQPQFIKSRVNATCASKYDYLDAFSGKYEHCGIELPSESQHSSQIESSARPNEIVRSPMELIKESKLDYDDTTDDNYEQSHFLNTPRYVSIP